MDIIPFRGVQVLIDALERNKRQIAYELIKTGWGKGTTSREELFDSVPLPLLLDFIYGWLATDRDQEQMEELNSYVFPVEKKKMTPAERKAARAERMAFVNNAM